MSSNESGFASKVGKGTRVSGKFQFKGPARIEGEADGEIVGDEIVVAAGAVVNARITAARVTVAGTLSGELIATERVELLETARVRCSINAPRLVLTEGAKFDGECKMPLNRAAA